MLLLERTSQLAALADYAREADAGRGRLVLLSGEAGIGKSSLLEQLRTDLPAAQWIWGACDSLFTPRPLAPLHDIAGQVGGDLAELCRTEAPREQLFAALLDQVSSGDVLTVCVVEDIHWADEATLDLLRFVGRRIRDSRALVVATYRDERLSAKDPLRIALGELATQRPTRRVTLPALSAEAVAVLLAGSDVEPAEAFRLSSGNPFYLTEILRHGVGELPSSARDAVLADLASLTAPARNVVDVAALMGTRVDLPLLEAVTDASPADLDEVLASGVLVTDDERLRFRHEIARLAVEQEIAVHRRAPIHRRILDALLESGATQDDARLAFHSDGASDAGRVLAHAPRAARQAADHAAHRDAVAQYQRAVRYADRADERTGAELYDALALELSIVDRWEESAQARQQALSLWRRSGDRVREARSLGSYSTVAWRLCHGLECDEAQLASLEILEPLGPSADLAVSLAGLASSRSEEGRSRDALSLVERVRAVAGPLGLTEVLLDVLSTEGWAIATLGGDWEGSIKESLQLARSEGLAVAAGLAYINLYTLYRSSLRFAEAEHYYVEGVAYCEEQEVRTFATCLRGERSGAMSQLGRWAEAAALADDLLHHAASPINRLAPLTELGRLRARTGADGVWEPLDEAAALTDGLQQPTYIQQARLARAEAHWLQGDLDAARLEIEQAQAIAGLCSPHRRSEIAAWACRVGAPVASADDLVEPYASEVAGDWARASALWTELGCEYDAALARLQSTDEAALRDAHAAFARLGAIAAERLARQRMREVGVRSVPHGARADTRTHPAGLTRREHEVLELVCAGHTNEEIAGHLVISVKTVDHHVSAVLGKLGVPSRKVAAAEAMRLGLVAAAR